MKVSTFIITVVLAFAAGAFASAVLAQEGAPTPEEASDLISQHGPTVGLTVLVTLSLLALAWYIVKKRREPTLPLAAAAVGLSVLFAGCAGTMFPRELAERAHANTVRFRQVQESLYGLAGDRIPDSIKLRNATWQEDAEAVTKQILDSAK